MDPVRWRLIEKIFHEALDQKPEERAACVSSACAGDADLQREVESLLVKVNSSFLLDRPVWEPLLALQSEIPGKIDVATCGLPDQSGANQSPRVELAGRALSHYQLLAKLGSGGMGEVWSARDTRLGRVVAIKMLLPEIASDADQILRLGREARMAATLNHPGIAAVYDTGEQDGIHYIVSEFVEGQTLRAVLKDGPLLRRRAIAIAAQVARALSVAHAAGIVHRDLKPENIIISRQGVAKILDFGISRRIFTRPEDDPTATATITREGSLVGTPGYMSPEQIRGAVPDSRSDIFSFGLVILEMLTGRPAFHNSTPIETMNAILNDDPPGLSTFNSLFPGSLAKIVLHCLAKDPEERFQSARDLAFNLEAIDQATDSGPSAPPAHKSRWVTTLSTVLAMLALAAFALSRLRLKPEPASDLSQRLSITLPDDAPLAPAGLISPAHDRPALALSPSGAQLAYVAQVKGGTRLCVRDMASGTVTPLADTDGGHTPFFSPNGAYIAFFADAKLKKIPSTGGAVSILAEAPNPWGGDWGPDDVIYFSRFEGEEIFSVPADGGQIQRIASGVSFMPHSLGRGMHLLVTSADGATTRFINEQRAAKLVVSGFAAKYSPSGHLVYAEPGSLWAVPFNPSSGEVSGRAVQIFGDLRTATYGVAQFALARNGTLVYASGRPQSMTSFVWVDRHGKTQPLDLPEGHYFSFDISPDGNRLAFTTVSTAPGAEGEIMIRDLRLNVTSRLSPRATGKLPAMNRFPRWTPDGEHVIYLSNLGLQRLLMWAPADRSAPPSVIWAADPHGPSYLYPMSFSPDGSVLVAFGPSPGGSFNIWLLHLKGGGQPAVLDPKPYLDDDLGGVFAQISPDGHWMLFASDRSGRYESYVTAFPKPGAIHQISSNSGREPIWNPNGSEIDFVSGSSMFAVDVAPGPEFRNGPTRFLFDGPYPDVPGHGFDISPDGRRFLMLQNKDILRPTRTLTVVTNFFDELKRRAPARASGK
jgi:serine/threonine-protein kinase